MPNGLNALEHGRPQPAQAIRDAVAAAYATDAGELLQLCRARVRMLLGGRVASEDPRLLAVGDYARSPLFDDTERLVLEFAEQYVLDVANTPDDLISALRDRLGVDRLYALVMGLYAIDQAERLELSAAVHQAAAR